MKAGVVHLACAHLATLSPSNGDWLSASERQRLAAITTPRRRAQFLGSRWLARWLLWQVHDDVLPADWQLEAPTDAPPRVPGRSDLVLSISHSGDFTACALAAEPVGVDLEHPQRSRDISGLIALTCTVSEQRLFATLGDAEREALFYELWTVKEAWLKRRGKWIAPQALQRMDAVPSPDGQVQTWRCSAWWLAVTATKVKWWSAEPERLQAWRVDDMDVRPA